MKRFLLWSFERGSNQYDVICALILAFIFLTPASSFNDRPDFMRVSPDQSVRRTRDDNGNTVFTVKVDTPVFTPVSASEKLAVERLREVIHAKFAVSRMEPVYDTTGVLVAYSIWIDSGVEPF